MRSRRTKNQIDVSVSFKPSVSLEHLHSRQTDILMKSHFGKYFLEKGFSVTGIDLSDKAIELAQEKTKHFGSKASWIKGNASDFDLGQKFSLAVSTFDSLNYLEDLNALESCFKCVDNHLLDKGFF